MRINMLNKARSVSATDLVPDVKAAGAPKSLRRTAFTSVVLSTAAVVACLLSFPMVIQYVTRLRSLAQGELEFCKYKSKTLLQEAIRLQDQRGFQNRRYANGRRDPRSLAQTAFLVDDRVAGETGSPSAVVTGEREQKLARLEDLYKYIDETAFPGEIGRKLFRDSTETSSGKQRRSSSNNFDRVDLVKLAEKAFVQRTAHEKKPAMYFSNPRTTDGDRGDFDNFDSNKYHTAEGQNISGSEAESSIDAKLQHRFRTIEKDISDEEIPHYKQLLEEEENRRQISRTTEYFGEEEKPHRSSGDSHSSSQQTGEGGSEDTSVSSLSSSTVEGGKFRKDETSKSSSGGLRRLPPRHPAEPETVDYFQSVDEIFEQSRASSSSLQSEYSATYEDRGLEVDERDLYDDRGGVDLPMPCCCQQGPSGPPGDAGKPGKDGYPGEDGEKGKPGADARPGETIAPVPDQCPCKRPAGPQGPPGLRGEPGQHGSPGENGIDNKPGQPGPAGPKGPAGAAGRPGNKGSPGKYGTVKPGYPGSPGPAGHLGTPGNLGPPGKDGFPGKDGLPGRKGENGVIGKPGYDGKPGDPGFPGPQGETGPDGSCDHCPAARLAPGY